MGTPLAREVIVVERLAFHRRDDPSHEYRELLLYQDGAAHFSIWEVIGFLDGRDADWNPAGVRKRTKLAIGGEWHMRKQMADEAKRLCDEGLTSCDPTPAEGQ